MADNIEQQLEKVEKTQTNKEKPTVTALADLRQEVNDTAYLDEDKNPVELTDQEQNSIQGKLDAAQVSIDDIANMLDALDALAQQGKLSSEQLSKLDTLFNLHEELVRQKNELKGIFEQQVEEKREKAKAAVEEKKTELQDIHDLADEELGIAARDTNTTLAGLTEEFSYQIPFFGSATEKIILFFRKQIDDYADKDPSPISFRVQQYINTAKAYIQRQVADGADNTFTYDEIQDLTFQNIDQKAAETAVWFSKELGKTIELDARVLDDQADVDAMRRKLLEYYDKLKKDIPSDASQAEQQEYLTYLNNKWSYVIGEKYNGKNDDFLRQIDNAELEEIVKGNSIKSFSDWQLQKE